MKYNISVTGSTTPRLQTRLTPLGSAVRTGRSVGRLFLFGASHVLKLIPYGREIPLWLLNNNCLLRKSRSMQRVSGCDTIRITYRALWIYVRERERERERERGERERERDGQMDGRTHREELKERKRKKKE